MKRISFIALLAIGISQLIFSQFKEGYIIKNNNDTIRGYINWEGSIINSNHCEFKLTPDGESQKYKPGEISAFRFNDSKFFSTWDLNTNNQVKRVFIEWLIKGRASILAYSGEGAEIKYFLLTEDSKLTELTNTMQEFVNDGVSYKRNNQEYKNILLYNFRDCPSLDAQIKSTLLDGKALLKITKKYHEMTCTTENCVVFEEKSRNMVFDWGVYSGFLSSKWILNSDLPEKVYSANSFGYGLALNISNLPALSPKFSVKVNFAIFSSMYIYDTTDVMPLITDDRIVKIGYAKIPIQLSYRFTHKKLSPYISGGGTVNVRFSYKQFDQHLTDWITRSRPSNPYTSKVNPMQFGLSSGFGFEYISSPGLRFNLGYDFELCPRLYGTYADDHSRVMNNIIYLRAYFF